MYKCLKTCFLLDLLTDYSMLPYPTTPPDSDVDDVAFDPTSNYLGHTLNADVEVQEIYY